MRTIKPKYGKGQIVFYKRYSETITRAEISKIIDNGDFFSYKVDSQEIPEAEITLKPDTFVEEVIEYHKNRITVLEKDIQNEKAKIIAVKKIL